MSFARNLIADLVAKRLWPVAVLLLVALVAVPVALRGKTEEPPTAPVASATPNGGTSPVVSLASDGPRGGRSTTGRNPFMQHDVGRTVSPAPTTVTSPTPTSSATPSTAGTSVGSPVPTSSVSGLGDVVPVGGSGSGATATTPVTRTSTKDSYAVDIRFGQDGKLDAKTNVPRLSPLPSAEDPFFVFMGVLADGKTALFLVSSDAEATGDGRCLPSVASCERIEMKAGESEFFDVVKPDGTKVQYQLDLVRVARERAATAAVAAAARTRESTAGRQLLRHAVDTGQVQISDLAFSPRMGLVVPSGRDQEQPGGLFGGYRVDLRFGAPGELVKRYDLARLTPLPSVDSPSFIYLGVLGDGKTALFLNPSDAAASGDAVCDPTPQECDRVEMKAGQSATFDVATIDGSSTQYQLDVDAISPVQAATPAEALASRTRESPAGRVVLRRLITEVGALVSDLSFSAKEGAVVPAK